jgi:hypothetical protein
MMMHININNRSFLEKKSAFISAYLLWWNININCDKKNDVLVNVTVKIN